jgi:hypothetical protein
VQGYEDCRENGTCEPLFWNRFSENEKKALLDIPTKNQKLLEGVPEKRIKSFKFEKRTE